MLLRRRRATHSSPGRRYSKNRAHGIRSPINPVSAGCNQGAILVPCTASFLPKSGHGGDARGKALLVGRVRLWRELDERVKRDFHPRTSFLGHVHEVGVDAAQDGLVRHDEDVFRALEFHDDGFEADDDVAVAFAAEVAVVVFVVVACLEVLGVHLFNVSVRQTVAHPRIEFI